MPHIPSNFTHDMVLAMPHQVVGVSGRVPSARAAGSFGSDDDTACSAAPAELLRTSSIWNSSTAQGDTCDTLEPQTKPDFDFDDEHSSTSSVHSSVIDLTSTVASDSDFEVVESDQELQQADGQSDYYPPVNRSSSIAGLFSRTKSKARKKSKQATGALPETGLPGTTTMDAGSSSANYDDSEWQQAGHNADAQDLAGPGAHGFLECTVSSPQKEGEGTQNAYISYLVTTETDFKSFQSSHGSVRRRYTDFVFLYKTLSKEYPQCAVPPLPPQNNISHARGQGFATEFTNRRAYSLSRFLKRLTLHPVLRRAAILTLFLESSDWNATMKSRPQRGMSGSESGGGGVLETWTDSFLNAFSKVHKTDKRFAEVNDRAGKLDEDLGTVSKTVARVAKRESDLETDYADLATQFQKLASLEPGVQDELTKFATSLQSTSEGWRDLQAHTDQSYLGSLKDMEAYITSVKALLKTREQKQLDFEGLTEYLNKAAFERDTLASTGHASNLSTTAFLRQKIEDVRGVDHEQSRRERQRKLEVQISRLQTEVEGAKKTSEAFDEEVVKEVQDFERIKAVEFRDALGGLADVQMDFFKNNMEIWQRFLSDMEREQESAGQQR